MSVLQSSSVRSAACGTRLTYGTLAAILSIVCTVGACESLPDGNDDEFAAAGGREAAAATTANIRPCPPGPVANYLEPEAQRCWYTAANGRWQTVSHDLHYDTLVVRTEAEYLRDADEIIRRFVDVHRERFSEILVYVEPVDKTPPVEVRRVQWTERGGYDTLDFVRAPE